MDYKNPKSDCYILYEILKLGKWQVRIRYMKSGTWNPGIAKSDTLESGTLKPSAWNPIKVNPTVMESIGFPNPTLVKSDTLVADFRESDSFEIWYCVWICILLIVWCHEWIINIWSNIFMGFGLIDCYCVFRQSKGSVTLDFWVLQLRLKGEWMLNVNGKDYG